MGDEVERGAEKVLAAGLYLVPTPIGNLEDITLRALRVLRSADRIACEDTRQTGKLLHHFGISTPTVSYHLHNESGRAEELVALLREGARIAVVSDAGTPGIADPGEQIVKAAIAAGIDVFPLPGANAAVSALIASGFGTERFLFHGFLPAKEGQRRTALEGLERTGLTQVFYETPHRILETLADVVSIFGAEERVTVAREITKMHEEFLRGTAAAVRSALAERPQVRGEMVLVFAPAAAEVAGGRTLRDEVDALRQAEGLSEMEALKRVARGRGLGKSEAYRELQREGKRR